MNDVQKVKDAINIRDLIQKHGVTLKRTGSVMVGSCPFHTERHGSFVAYEDSYHCYGCNASGDVFSFIMQKLGMTFPDALAYLAQEAGITLEAKPQPANSGYEKRLCDMLELVLNAYQSKLASDEGKDALDYLRDKRGFSESIIRTFKLGYAPKGRHRMRSYLEKHGYTTTEMKDAGIVNAEGNDIFWERVIFPIRNTKGQTVGFGGRTLNPQDSIKYLNSPDSPVFHKSDHLYGFDHAKDAIRKSKVAIVVEGYADVVTAHQAGYLNTVAILGTSISETQIKALKNYADTLIFALDNDSAGQKATQRNLKLATDVLGKGYASRLDIGLKVAILDGKDPDAFILANKTEFGNRIANAPTVATYLIEIHKAQLGMSPDEKTRMDKALELFPILTATQTDGYQAIHIQMLATAMGLSPTALLETAKNASKKGQNAKRDKTPAMPKFETIERQILATILQDKTGGELFFRLSAKLMDMAGLDAVDSIPTDCDDATYGFFQYGFYPLSASDFSD